ncbi:uncharacterized protein LOC62_02G003220 [Vanrija pseudolonga]|uniref:Uncharacterized protein n=1 Tax=Vanrija pseudolonga TaxID=143232 RepID=A0AAF0Y3U8_9TREE|nr:hypothetical protein LOC62_02G003220 [Vanrija pseudolonga]
MPQVLDREKWGAESPYHFITYESARYLDATAQDDLSIMTIEDMCDSEVASKFTDCLEAPRSIIANLDELDAKRRDIRKRIIQDLTDSDDADPDGLTRAMSNMLPLWGDTSAFSKSTVKDLNEYKTSLSSEGIQPILKLLSGSLIRRKHTSHGRDGGPLNDLLPIQPTPVWVTLNLETKAWYQQFKKNNKKHNFATKERMALRFGPEIAPGGVYDHDKCPEVIEAMCQRILDDFAKAGDEPPEARGKVVITIKWTSGLSLLLAHMSKFGLFAMVMTGEHTADERHLKQQPFQAPEPHMSEPVAVPSKDGLRLEVLPPVPCNIFILSEVGLHGINLTNATSIHQLDSPWSWSAVDQTMGPPIESDSNAESSSSSTTPRTRSSP